MKKALIIGGGFAGLAAAHQLSLLPGKVWDVTILEAGSQLGAGVRTQFLGGHPYTFGPRHFLTQDETIFDYLNTYLPLRRHPDHQFLTYVEADAQFYNYPIHIDDIDRMSDEDQTAICAELDLIHDTPNLVGLAENFEEFWLSSIGPTLYDKFINTYSRKMWQINSNTQLNSFDWSPKGATIKHGPRAAWDSAISAYPIAHDGYNSYFDLASANATVKLKTKYMGNITTETAKQYSLVVSTIAPDTLFDYCYGKLPFIGRTVTPLVLPVEFALPHDVYFAYYAGGEPYTRVTEYKKFTKHYDPQSTLITIEQPSINGKLYPLPTASAQFLASRYLKQLPKNVHSIGRAGSYDYRVDIDDCIAQAINLVRSL